MNPHSSLTPPEVELLNAIKANERVVFPKPGVEIRGSVLGRILLGDKNIRPRKLCLSGVRVVGPLDLEAGDIRFVVKFERCVFKEAPNLEQARTSGLYFVDCELPGFWGTQLTVGGSLSLNNCVISGAVELNGAHVLGQVNLRGSRISNGPETAINADGLCVEQDMLCSDGFHAEGLTKMVGAAINGQFICDGAKFSNPGETALELSGLTVKEHTFWRNGFTVNGKVSLRGARIDGKLDCSAAVFVNPGEVAVEAVGLTVAQEAKFSSKCKVDGGVNLTGCTIGGWLEFSGGEFTSTAGKALDLARASIAQNLIFREKCVVNGEVFLAGAEVNGSVWAEGGRFAVIDATGLRVRRDVLFCQAGKHPGDEFQARGSVVLNDADLGGCLNFTGARVEGELECDRAKVGRSVLFNSFHAGRDVRMCDAKIGAELSFVSASLADNLVLTGIVVDGSLKFRFAKPPGEIDLVRARAAALDERGSQLPAKMKLDDFVYGSLREADDVDARTKWLRENHEYVPQVYLQLASTYSATGRHDLATRVLMAGEDARRKAGTGFLGGVNRVFGWLLKPTVGYGYRPFRILWSLAALQLTGWLIFVRIGVGGFEPIRDQVKAHWFSPFLYTADLLLPVVSLKHRDLWIPQGGAAWLSATFTIMGWILAICLVTGVGRMFKRDA